MNAPRDHGPVRWLSRLGLRRPAPQESVEWEIEHHIAELADRLSAGGMGQQEARREAERRFGEKARYGPSMQRLERRRMAMERRTGWWDVVREGFASVARTARRYPGFTLGVVLTLGLGIGANATMYGIVDRLLLQPPYGIEDPDRVMLMFRQRPNPLTGETSMGSTITYPDYADLKVATTFDAAAYTHAGAMTVGNGENAYQMQIALASVEFFPLLGIEPRMGRFFAEEDGVVGAPLMAVLSEDYWWRELGATPDVLGRSLEVQGVEATVIGVAPRGFTGPDLARVDAWLPLEPTHVLQNGDDACLTSRGCWWMRSIARLRGGSTQEAAESEATALHRNGRRGMTEQGRSPEESRIVLGPIIAADGPEASDETEVARWLAGVSLIVLLIACANVANLLMARGSRLRREVGVRLALGASRGRVVANTIVESVLLAIGGAGVALVIARWGGSVVRSGLLPGVYFPNESVSGRLLAFTLVAALFAGLVSALAPALQGRRAELTGALGEAARGASAGRSRLRGALTIAQAAMSVVLLVGAGLFVRSLGELRSLDLGLDVDHLLLASLELTRDLTPEEQGALYEEAARTVRGVAGVVSTAAVGVPFQWGFATSLRVQGLDSIPTLPGGGPYYYPVTPTYFETVGVRVVRGRGIEAGDMEGGERVAVVSETMERTLWPQESALGQCLVVGRDSEECTLVVGVVEDAARGGYQDEPFMAYYLPTTQVSMAIRALYARVDAEASHRVPEVASALRGFSPEVRFADVRDLRGMLDPQARAWTLGAMMFSVFGLLALALAAIGLYSVLAFDVAQRTREIGIRTALGAAKPRLLRAVIAQGSRLALFGVVLGVGFAWLAAPYAGDLLFRVSPRDPGVLIAVSLVLLVVSAAASLVPGLRATGVDPMIALRTE